MRLDKFLSNRGFGSRSACKKIISRQHVTVNGQITTKNDMEINGGDIIALDGKVIENSPYATLIMNKPAGYMCSMIDERYPSVMNLVPDLYRKRVKMVGRLDQDTTGLLILTDNGVMNARLASPKYHIGKVYQVDVDKPLIQDLIPLFKAGDIDIGRGNRSDSATLEILSDTQALVTVHEGKYHEVKNLFRHFGYEVVHLKRLKFGPIDLGDIKEGEFRLVTEEEYDELLEMTHLNKEEQL